MGGSGSSVTGVSSSNGHKKWPKKLKLPIKGSVTTPQVDVAQVTEKSRDTALKTTIMMVTSPQNFNTGYLNLSDFVEFLGNESPLSLTLPFSTCQTSVSLVTTKFNLQ